jgi:hypothetical protein
MNADRVSRSKHRVAPLLSGRSQAYRSGAGLELDRPPSHGFPQVMHDRFYFRDFSHDLYNERVQSPSWQKMREKTRNENKKRGVEAPRFSSH